MSVVDLVPGAADLDPGVPAIVPVDETRGPVPDAWNRTEADYPAASCIHALFEAQVERTPDAVAVIHEDTRLTYRELNQRANRLAHHLRRLGAGPDVRVGVCLERGVELVATLMAVLKSGGAYVPLDPAYPAERLELMLEDSGAAVLVTQEKLRGLLPVAGGVHVVTLEGAAEEIAREDAGDPAGVRDSRNLAYLIYTSGSTGRPKGVAIEHRTTVALLAWAWGAFSPQELGGMLASTSVCFDLSVFEIFTPLARGGRVIVVENALALPRSVAAGEVRLVNTVPSAIAALLDSSGIPAGVRTVNLAGELLKPELVDALYAHGIERVVDSYGPSETTTYSTSALRRPGAAGTIGAPIANTRCYVMDPALRPVDVGEAGELYLAGGGVTRGYLGRPGLTADRYPPDPYSATPGARMYRTGDRVRWMPDATLEYLGRLDNQVKIRGYRVEPGEIEAVLRQHPGVRDVVVTAYEHKPGDRRLAAYLVPRAAGGAAPADAAAEDVRELVRALRRAVRERLPEYMMPSAFVPLERFPLSPNGKVDRRALPAPPARSDEVETPYVAPRTVTETQVAAIWAEVLGLPGLGVEDDVFALGAHSLAITQVASRLRARVGVELPLGELFAARTVAALAAAVERRGTRPSAPAGGALVHAPRDGRLALSAGQEQVWFLIQLAPDNLSYNFQALLTFRGELDQAALRDSLSEIIRRHEVFRTTFPAENGRPWQEVHPPYEADLPLVDLSGLDPEARAEEEQRLRREAFAEAFDVTALPLVRWFLVRRGPREHVLVHREHHVVHDGWSFHVFLRDLLALYEAFAAGRPSPLPELPWQFADYAYAQRRWLEGDEARAQVEFWRARLAGSPPMLTLPLDRPRPAEQHFRGAAPRYELSAALYGRLRDASRRSGVTLFGTMMAAYHVLLWRWSGQADLSIGTGIANRRAGETHDLIGMFVNAVVVRSRVDEDLPFAEFARRVHAEALAAAENQEVPFETVVEALRPDRSLGHNPLFQAMFSFHDAPIPELSLPGMEVEVTPALSNGSSKFDLDVVAIPRAEQRVGQGHTGDADGITLVWEHNSDLFEAATMEAMANQYRTLLEAVAGDPERRVGSLELMDGAERSRVLEAWNPAAAKGPAALSVHRAVEAQAARTPGAAAIVSAGRETGYRELNARANRLAHHLRTLGVGPEVRVGVCLERSAELVVAVLAVLKAGGAYVPLDPAYPADRLAFMLADSGAAVLVAHGPTLAAVAAQPDVRLLDLDAASAAIAAERDDDPAGGAEPGNLAYVIYTSGSTGTPKGVGVEHRALAAYVAGAAREYGLGAGDRVLQYHSVSFDPAAEEIFATLASGAALVPLADALAEPAILWELCRREGVTVLDLPTAVWHTLVPHLGTDPAALPATLRLLVMGGERALPGAVAAWWRVAGERVRLLNSYGPTETTIGATLWDAAEAAGAEEPVVLIGRPVPDCRVYVLDGEMKPVPPGVPGELCVGGVQVARGYLGRPAGTAERFVPDPFGPRAGARLYRTGDRGRWRPDGTLEYLGRVDEQVKIRGFRIEPGEIEGVLRRHAGVSACAVVAREDVPGEQRLVAYVVGGAAPEALREHLRRTLPEYMVPAAIVPLERLPLTPNGKLDRRALPAPDFASDDTAYAAPRTPVEEVLAEIWAGVLPVERVGVNDNFFALGGHSLLATRVASRVRELLGVELRVRAIFEGPTVAGLADAVEALRRAAIPAPAPIVSAGRERPLPLSFAQERLWFLDRLEQGSALYNLRIPLRLEGELDVPALERALGEIVRRHDVLRTTLAEAGGTPVQEVAPFSGFALPVEEVPGADAALRRASAEGERPFDLETGPLFRALLLRLAPADHLLTLTMHHAVGDGWSTGVLLRELSTLYAAYREGGDSPLAELAVQYADYAAWQREQLRGPVLERELAFWKERLSGAPALLELPTDHPRPAVQRHRGAREPVLVAAGLREALEALARREGATLYMVLLGAFQLLLGRYAGSDDVVVGTPIAGRTRAEVEPLIGLFVNTLVMRTSLSGNPSFREVLGRVRETTLAAYEHQDVPFERLVEALDPVRSLSHQALFQVVFQLENLDRSGGDLAGLRTGTAALEIPTAKFDLALDLASDAGGLRGTMEYATDLFDRSTVLRMLGHLTCVLDQAAADADVRLSEMVLIGRAERRQVVEEWNPAGAPFPADGGIAAIFEAQAAATPDAVAVAYGDDSLTYARLDRASNRLARRLRALDIGPDTRVALCLEPGCGMIVTLLGILKAGGAYVTLDPGYPAERLAMMLEDAGASALVTTSSLVRALPAGDTPVVLLDRDDLSSGDDAPLAVEVDSDNLAYLVYTSGSTGRPNGVMVTHRAVVRLVRETDYTQVRAGERVAQTANTSFDAAMFEIWAPLLNGGTLVGIGRDVLLDPGAVVAALRESRIDTLFLTTALFNAVARESPGGFGTLETVHFGGEAADAESVRRVLESGAAPGRLLHMYGPAEVTTYATWHHVESVAPGAVTVPIGRAIANTTAYVLDPHLRPVPIGLRGELYLGGPGVARGYRMRPGHTAGRFVPDAFSATPGARMYRTGDRVRWNARGEIEFLGRADDQVKIRGFRIEPGEVESVLSAHPAVRRARVVVREDEPGEKRLVAYVVGEIGADALRAHLRESMPEHMVPAAFVTLDSLPLTPNGKLDLRALPAPELASGDGYAAPATPVEEVLAGIWAEVLRVERVGTAHGFFELGGHSLLATRVMSRIRAAFGVELPLRALFEGPTVGALAARVEALRRAGAPALPPVPRLERDRAPLSFAQERLWFLDRLEPGSTLYNLPMPLRLEGALDVPALERALGEVVRRHGALRTTFADVEGTPQQRVAPFAGFTLPVEAVPGADAAEREAEALRRARAEGERPFDLETGPLFRATLLRLADEEHLLLLSLHHIVSDEWSESVLFGELSALYADFSAGGEASLPALPVEYADFAAWQREQLQGEGMERQLAYWRERLAGAPALLELPTDRRRPAVQTYRGAHERFALPGELLERLRAVGRQEGVTLYMVLLGAFQLLLSRYTGSVDVVVGSPIAGRTRGEVEGLIGFFVNTLVLRTGLGGDPAFREVLRRVREVTLGAYEHQEVPFERLVEALQPERSLGHNPLVQAFFSYHDQPPAQPRLAGIRAVPVRVPADGAKFDLSLHLTPGEDGVAGMLEYASDLFDAATIRRMAGHLRLLLEGVAADPGRRLSALPLVTDAERRTLSAWSGAGAAVPVRGALHHRFEARAAARPKAIALTCGGQSLTYAALNARANRLARRLRAHGVVAEQHVGLCAERSLELVTGILAILKAGGAYVPLDPAYPPERLAYMAEDAGIRVLLAPAALRDRILVHGVEAVALDDVPIDELPDDLGVPLSADNLAYVIYTSGSTGQPKGVGVTHGNVLRLFDSTAEGFGFGEDDVWTLFHSSAFDFSVWEIWGALLHGGRLVVVPWEVSRDPGAFHALLRSEAVTVLSQTPSAFRALAAADEAEAEALERLRTVVFGGEALQYESLRGWLDRYGPRRPRLVNMYGITETTVHVTWHTVTGRELKDAGAGSGVGTPLPDLRACVLDPAGNPAPIGVAGELRVGGAGVARGYLGRPGLTAERFVPDPFTGHPGARLYRSGDLARWKADGTLEYLGRGDQQVKLRGFRIELGEIESALLAQPSVAAAAVAVNGAGDDAALVAYVVPAGGAVHAPELREALKRRLPEYMVPAAFVALDRIPLTANGKVDRRALPEPDGAGIAAGGAHVAPATPVEEVLAGIWAEVLRVERVGTADSFFELGGHSLLATRVASRVRAAFGVELPLRALFEGPTVAALAGWVEALRRAGAPPLPPVARLERDRAPLSFAQERLWFLDRLEPGSALYNLPLPLRLEGALDVSALERALGEIVRRHGVLRTTFVEVAGTPLQVVAPFAGFTLPVEKVPGAGAAEREAAALRRMQAEWPRPFDLETGPLFRALLLALGDEDHLLLLCMHHAVGDEWSTEVLLGELAALYAAYRVGGESPLAELPVQYVDYAAWQHAELRGEGLERQLAYWTERLSGAPALLELPTDHPRPAVQTHRGAREPVLVAAEVLGGLEALARREGATLYMVLLGAFQLLLGRYAGSGDVVVGTPIAGRTRAEVEPLIGLFVNTLVMRTELSGNPSFRELLGRVRDTTLAAYEHQDVPFERLVEALEPERSLSHQALFQVVFQLESPAPPGGGLPGIRTAEVALQVPAAKFDLTLGFAHADGGLRGAMDYATDLFDRSSVSRMLGHLVRVLEQVAADADRPVDALELIGADERRMVLEEWNRTGRPFPRGVAIPALFAARVAERPDAPALVWGGTRLSYAELDARANRLAHHLAGLGVGPESRVGVLLERGVELIVSLLAVLKAGGCYVPLDPAYPPERLALMLADAGVRVLLTRGPASSPHAPGVAVVRLDEAAEALAAAPAGAPRSGAHPDSLAYIVYTSGSTGRPKGVMVAHRHVVQLVMETDYVTLAPGDRVAQASSASFDALTFEVWGALLNGATLVGIDREVLLSPPALHRALREQEITTLYQTTALLNQLSREQPDVFAPLREVLFGGQAADAESVRRILEAGGPRRLLHMYGPTETTAWCSWEQVEHVEEDALTVSVGRPTGNQRIYVLDAALQPVPVGMPGEAYVGGDGVVRGYLDRPALTAERFVPDPFAAEPGARMYRTGDRVRWHADGRLEFVGRLDDQVKIRGFRIEPGEVESVLSAHPAVREARVVVRDDGPGERRLVAYVVGEIDADALRAHLRRSLPEYMVPAAFVALASLPLTVSGKLDLKALPAPDLAPGEGYVAPATPVEEKLAAIWAEVLRLERVGTSQNFFEIGGHSLMATRVVSRIRAELDVEVPLRALFEGPTVSELAGVVEALCRAGTLALPPILPIARESLAAARERAAHLATPGLDP
jgi:amino acid adenylation domain-containing protein